MGEQFARAAPFEGFFALFTTLKTIALDGVIHGVARTILYALTRERGSALTHVSTFVATSVSRRVTLLICLAHDLLASLALLISAFGLFTFRRLRIPCVIRVLATSTP